MPSRISCNSITICESTDVSILFCSPESCDPHSPRHRTAFSTLSDPAKPLPTNQQPQPQKVGVVGWSWSWCVGERGLCVG
jgi:hypothetical protein